MALWAIPDIHGEYDKLNDVLLKLLSGGLDLKTDTLVFLGDYVDRGPDSKKVLDRIFSLATDHPDNVILLAGNHEWLMINALTRNMFEDEALWALNGGEATRWSFRKSLSDGAQEAMQGYAKKLAALPKYYEKDGFVFSHAPLFKGIDHRKADKHALIWSYADSDLPFGLEPGNWIGVCGHIHRLRENIWEPRLEVNPGYLFLDSGCGCHENAQLFAVEVNTKKMVRSGA